MHNYYECITKRFHVCFSESGAFRMCCGAEITAAMLWISGHEKTAGSPEYRISYDLGYDGGKLADAETIGGKLYNAAVPAAREGYTFVGWWVSTANESGKLSYRFEEGSENGGTVFTADTTLFAVWQQANATFAVPAVSVSDTAVTWDSVGSTAYLVKITAPDGSVMVDNQRTTTTLFPVSFAMAGDYRIEVTAVDAGGNAVTETAVRVYTNKALDRVGGFTVHCTHSGRRPPRVWSISTRAAVR